MSLFHAIYGKGGVSPEPGGDTYGETQVLLWTNSNTKTPFAEQSVSINLNNYDGVIVEFYKNVNSTDIASRIKVTKQSVDYAEFGCGFANLPGNNQGRARNIVSVTNAGVKFSSAGDETTTNNHILIPYRIFGYREYKKETLTSAITNQKAANANTNVNIGKGNYALVSHLGAEASSPTVSKGTLISYAYHVTGSNYAKAYLVKADNNGIINCGTSINYQIVTVG